MNQKTMRILKLRDKGLGEAQIAKKIGYQDSNIEEGIQRVRDALNRHAVGPVPVEAQFGVEDTPKGSVFLS